MESVLKFKGKLFQKLGVPNYHCTTSNRERKHAEIIYSYVIVVSWLPWLLTSCPVVRLHHSVTVPGTCVMAP